MKSRLIIIFALLVIASGSAFISASKAFAGTGNQWCNSLGYCYNAWNGGPFVKDYAYSTGNNDFTIIASVNECNGGITTSTCPGHGIAAGLPIVGIEFTGGGSWNGQCIGDAYNDPSHADSSLDSCPSQNVGGGTGGWGTNLVEVPESMNGLGQCQSGSGGWALFYDIHWNGILGSPGGSNGNTQYLNNASGDCVRALPAA